MNVRNNHPVRGIISGIIAVVVGIFMYILYPRQPADFSFVVPFIFLSLSVFLSGSISNSDIKGRPLRRKDLREGVCFRLEKISGPGNEGLYFLWQDNNEKFMYADLREFKNGSYIIDKGKLCPVEEYSEIFA